jgi:predicted amidophosphoribosyltransferase
MYCSKCGMELAKKARFCKSCGSPAKPEAEAAGPAHRGYPPPAARVQEAGAAGDYTLSRQDMVLIVCMLACSALMIIVFALTL